MNVQDEEVTVEAYVRSQQLMEPIDSKLETLRRLESTDRIDDLSLHVWPEKITLSEQTPYSDAIDAFERIQAWADEQGVSVRPPFSVRTTTSTVTNETRTTLRTPVMCLAVHVGERLVNVFPHSRGDDQYSATDAIAALRTGELDLFPFTPEPAARPPDRCPTCGTPLTNVQGIGVCQDCDRIEPGTTRRRRHGHRPSSAHRT